MRAIPGLARAAAAVAALSAFPAQAWALGLQLQSAFSFQSDSSGPSSGNASTTLTQSDSAVELRARAEFTLMTRKERRLELLLGPYLRYSLAFSLSNYGTDVQSPSALELGGDAGLSWFGYFRTFLTGTPSWSMTYDSGGNTLGGSSQDLVQFSYKHWSVGGRIEVPWWVFDSEDGDHKVEVGPYFTYELDRISQIQTRPDTVVSSTNPGLYYRDFSGTQSAGHRWALGAFVNVRM